MVIVSLDDAKSHLNILDEADDAVISRLISAAENFLCGQLGFDPSVRFADLGIPASLKQAVLMTVAHWFENREATLVGVSAQSLPMGVAEIVANHRDWTF